MDLATAISTAADADLSAKTVASFHFHAQLAAMAVFVLASAACVPLAAAFVVRRVDPTFGRSDHFLRRFAVRGEIVAILALTVAVSFLMAWESGDRVVGRLAEARAEFTSSAACMRISSALGREAEALDPARTIRRRCGIA